MIIQKGVIQRITNRSEYKQLDNCDYLLISPIRTKKIKRMLWLGVLLFLLGIFITPLIMTYTEINQYLLMVVGGILILAGYLIVTKTKKNEVAWYINDYFPVQKPHNFQVGDVVLVKIQVNKEEEHE